MQRPLPLFISHGAPDIVLRDLPARRFLASLADRLPSPSAILAVSAHFETDHPAVVADPAPGMIYDFGGFDPRLNEIVYPAPGSEALARDVARLLRGEELDPVIVDRRGYDHGSWIPLMLMFPSADIPVVQLSVQPRRDPAHHLAVGRALAPLRGDNVLIVSTGAITHNLREVFRHIRAPSDEPTPPWVTAFLEWIGDRTAAGDIAALVDYRRSAPFAVENHPTDEHLLPFFVALGAAGEGAQGRRIHHSVDYAVQAMDSYVFGNAEELDGPEPLLESFSQAGESTPQHPPVTS